MDLNTMVLSKQERLIACLQENLRIPSVREEALPDAPYGVPVRKSLEHILNAAEAMGFRTCNVDNHIGWCEYGQGEEMVAVLGHLDVVPAGDGWSVDPWGGEIRDEKIFGRGSMDDKGPCVAALFALEALRDCGLPLKRRVRLLFGCCEETGAADVRYYLAQGGEIPVMGFTPDGEYPVIHGEKGILHAKCRRSLSQSGPLKLVFAQGGEADNVVPSYAKAELECDRALADIIAHTTMEKVTFTPTDTGVLVEAQGVNAHGSIPWAGENAIGRLILALNTLPFEGEMAQILRFLSEKVGMDTKGKLAGIHLWDAQSGDLSFNLGVITVENDTMELCFNYRYPVTFTYEDCAPAFQKLFEDMGFTVEQVHTNKLYIPADAPLIQTLLKVYKAHTGSEGTPICIGGGTYAKSLPNIVAFGPMFPGEEMREHKPDEYIEIPQLMKNAQIIASAMYEMAK